MSLPNWATKKQTKDLFGRACAYKAPPEILSDNDACEAYVRTIESFSAGTAGVTTGTPINNIPVCVYCGKDRNSLDSIRGIDGKLSICVEAPQSQGLGTAGVTTGISRRVCIDVSEAVFILCIKKESGELEFSCTAFAFTDKEVISAFHNICEPVEDEERGVTQIYNNCALVKCVKRSINGPASYFYEDPIDVSVVVYDIDNDWVVLRRTDNENFKMFLSICPREELPRLKDDLTIKPVRCPLKNLVNYNDVKIWQLSRNKVAQYSYDENRLYIAGGLYAGFSGGPYVDENGRAVGMHLESSDEIKKGKHCHASAIYNKIKRKRLNYLGLYVEELSTVVNDLSSIVSDNADTDNLTSEGLLLCQCQGIMSRISSLSSI